MEIYLRDEMAEEHIPFLKFPYGFFILTSTPLPPLPHILRIAVVGIETICYTTIVIKMFH